MTHVPNFSHPPKISGRDCAVPLGGGMDLLCLLHLARKQIYVEQLDDFL